MTPEEIQTEIDAYRSESVVRVVLDANEVATSGVLWSGTP
jgi:hypothetical protein